MSTLIFRTISPYLASLMVIFSVFVLLRGHNEPGGGFIGGLIAVSAIAILGISGGVAPVRRALFFHPIQISAFGLFLATIAGILSLFTGDPFMTGLWVYPEIFGVTVDLSTPLIFDIGVYLVVVGSISSIVLVVEEREGKSWK